MAGIKAYGFEDLVRKTKELSAEISFAALTAAEDTAAKYMRTAIKRAAPRKTGQLEKSVQILRGRAKQTRSGATIAVGRVMVGPTKLKGYYGFWLDKGRKGFELTGQKWRVKTKKALHWKDDVGSDVFARSAKVGPVGATHWFQAAVDASEIGAEKAGREAFDKRLQEILKARGMD